MERRLAAVLAADVAGYSLLMGRDEEGTITQLKNLPENAGRPHNRGASGPDRQDDRRRHAGGVRQCGRCGALRGGGPTGVAAENVDVPQQTRIEFRIGIHVGDIIFDDNDIFGDGVNIAAPAGGNRSARGHHHF